MKRFGMILLLLLAVCVAAFCVTSMQSGIQSGGVENGALDLREIDLTAQVVSLDGEWEFVYGELLPPAAFPDGGGLPITVPASWSAAGYPTFGCGTYRLSIQTDGDDLLLFLPAIDSAAIVYVNGAPVYSAGEVSASRDEARAGVGNTFVPVVAQDGAVELLVQVSNYDIWESGLVFPPLIGGTQPLLRHIWGQRLALAAVMGGILLIGMYHLILFLFRRREKTYLAFCVTCLLVVLRLMLDNNAPLQFLLPDGAGLALLKGYALMFCLNIISIVVFMVLAFEMKPGRKARLFFLVTLGLPVAASFCPAPIPFLGVMVLMLPLAVILVMGARRVEVRRNPYRLLYLCSIAVFLGNGLILGNGEMAKLLFGYSLYATGAAPNLFMILCQFVMLSQSYAAAHNEVERVNANLENLVDQRTRELHQTNLRLSASQAALREMIGNISHDLKTPLTALNNYLELMGDEAQQSSEQEKAEYLGIAYHKNLDLQRLVHNLFEVTRLEGGAATYSPVPVPASALMEEAARKYEAQCRDRGIAFSARAEDGAGLYIDRDKIWSVLDNLVYNAMRHTPEGGSISIAARTAGEATVLTVSDTGEGIAAEHLPHVFERFYKASPERGKKDGSSGLGLYIVKTITEAMGGAVTVESEPGKGTVFTLTFPAGDEAEKLE